MRVLLIFIFHIICAYNSIGQSRARIEENFIDFVDTPYIHKFNKVVDNFVGIYMEEIKISYLDSNEIIIENYSNDMYSGVHIIFFIARNLKIKKVTYDTWSDMQLYEGSSKIFTVENPIITFNFDPFKHGINGLQGNYTFIIKEIFNPGKLLKKEEGVKQRITYETFRGKFKYEK